VTPSGVAAEEKERRRNCSAEHHNIDPGVPAMPRHSGHGIGNLSALDALRGRFKSPRDDKRDRKTYCDQDEKQADNPIRDLKERKDLRRNLRDHPTDHSISDGDLVDIAPLQLSEEIGRVQLRCSAEVKALDDASRSG